MLNISLQIVQVTCLILLLVGLYFSFRGVKMAIQKLPDIYAQLILAMNSKFDIAIESVSPDAFEEFQTSEVKKIIRRLDELESDYDSRFRKYYARINRLGTHDRTTKEPESEEDLPDVFVPDVPVNGQTPEDHVTQQKMWTGQDLKDGEQLIIKPYKGG